MREDGLRCLSCFTLVIVKRLMALAADARGRARTGGARPSRTQVTSPLTHTLSHTLSHSLTHTLSHTLSLTHTLSHSRSLSVTCNLDDYFTSTLITDLLTYSFSVEPNQRNSLFNSNLPVIELLNRSNLKIYSDYRDCNYTVTITAENRNYNNNIKFDFIITEESPPFITIHNYDTIINNKQYIYYIEDNLVSYDIEAGVGCFSGVRSRIIFVH